MSARRLLRIALAIAVLIVLWTRFGRDWFLGSLALTVILILVVIIELTGAQNKWRRMRDEVPKKPLGLE
jgi:membrane protein YdbS with pleckstrin-like domain